ncbi:hypothetical protein JCM3774_003973 [Rhodotorula dairenensis]
MRPRTGPVSVAAWTPLRSLATQTAPSPLSAPDHRSPHSSSSSSGSPNPPPPGSTEPKQRSATSEFYRALVPSMLHCLALGSIVYYALELGYLYLAREKEGETLSARVDQLEAELALERAGGPGRDPLAPEGEQQGHKSWWKLW